MNHEFGMLNQFEQEATLRLEPAHYQPQPHLPQYVGGMGLGLGQGEGAPTLGLHEQGPPPRLEEFTPIRLTNQGLEGDEELQTNNQLQGLLTLQGAEGTSPFDLKLQGAYQPGLSGSEL